MESIKMKYNLLELISQSQDSRVYLARKKDSRDYFLVKSLKERKDTAANIIDRKILFRKEINIVSSLDHPNIVKIVDTHFDGRTYTLIHPYRKGSTLAHIFRESASFSPPDSLYLIIQLLDALDYVHLRGIVHCDINPNNIFVDDEKGVILLDFGYAMTEEEAVKLPEGTIVGTTPYLSLEQMGCTDYKISGRSDLFCTAMILYRLLSGRLPFTIKNNSIEELFEKYPKAEVQPIKDLPATLNAVLIKALKPSPDDRYQTASGFRYDLKAAMEELGGKQRESFFVGKIDNIAALNRTKLFVARENEITALEKGFEQFEKGRHTSFLFYGTSGIGKTFIVNQFSKQIDESRYFFLRAKCNRFTSTQPYSIYRHLILEFILKISARTEQEINAFRNILNKTLSEFSGSICQALPELTEYFTEIKRASKVEKEKEADLINHILTVLLHTLTEIKPYIIFIDDLQWIDQTTFDILRNLLSISPKCMVIMNLRTEKESNDIYVHGNDLRKAGIKNIIPVLHFNKNDIKELIFSRFGEIRDSDRLVDMLAGKTDSSPFTLTEAISYLVNNSILQSAQQGWHFNTQDLDNLPQRFDSVSLIINKLNRLKPDETRFLSLASLIEGKFDRTIIEKLGNFTSGRSKAIAHKLENFGFITHQISGGYSFTHDKVKEVITSHIPKEEQYALNEKLGQLYESLLPQNREYLFNATECYLKSKNLKKSIEFCYQAATYAVEKTAFDVAIHYFKFTMLMAAQCPLVDLPVPIDMIKVQMDFGDVLMLSGINQQSLNIFQKLAKETSVLDKNQLLELKYKIGSIYHNMGEFENSIAFFTEALQRLNVKFPKNKFLLIFILLVEIFKQILFSYGLKHILPKKNQQKYLLIVKILNKLSYSLYFYDFVIALLAHFKSLNFADLLKNCFEKAETYSIHMVPIFQMLFKKRAFKYFRKSLNISQEINRNDALSFAQSFGGLIHFYDAKWKDAERYLNLSIKNYKSVGDSWGKVTPIEHLGYIAFSMGNLHQCKDVLEKEKTISEECNDLRGVIVAKRILFIIDLLTLNKITKNWTELRESQKELNDSLVNTLVNLSFSIKELLQNDIKDSYFNSKTSIRLIKENNFNQEYVASAYSNHCEILIQEKRNRSNENTQLSLSDKELLQELHTYSKKARFQGIVYPAHMGAAFRCKAWYYAFKGRKKKARKLFLKAIKKHHSLDMRYEEAKSIRDFGLFLDDCNLPGEARDQYNAAYKLFHICGAKLETDRLKEKADYDTSMLNLEQAMEEKADDATSAIRNVNQVRVDTLYDVSSSITEIDDIDVLFKQILNAMIKATGAQYAWLFLEQSERYDKKEMCIDYHGQIHNHEEIPFSRRIVKQVKEQRKVVLIRDVSQENGLLNVGDETGRIDLIRSVLCVPLCHLDNYLGCVYLGNNLVTGLFTDESKKIVQILSSQAGVLLENAYLMDEYKKLNKYLQQKVKEQTKDIREKNNQLITSNLKLVDSERMKNMLTGTIVHDIKNYAAGIEGNLNILSRKYSQDKPLKRTVDLVNMACIDIVNLTSNLLDIGRMEESKLEPKKESISYDEICSIVNQFKTNILFEERNITIETIPPAQNLTLYADRYLLTRVLQNLFSNAGKYAPKGGRVIVSMESADQEDTLCFYCSGTPVPDKDRQIIFDKYSRVEDKRTLYSKGLGLFFCKMVVTAHQGRIWLDTDETGNYFKLAFKKSLEQVNV